MDRYSKWPVANLCKMTDGKTAVKFFNDTLNGRKYLKPYEPTKGGRSQALLFEISVR